MSTQNNWESAFEQREDLQEQYGVSNALALYALELRFQIEDIDTVASQSLTDGSNDKKCDIVHLDKESGYLVVIQGYYSQHSKPSAPSNKAADLNTAAAWLFSCEHLESIPELLRSVAYEVRDALNSNDVRVIEFWYVHNRHQSTEVKRELIAVEHTINNAIKQRFKDAEVTYISAVEVGRETLDNWYRQVESPIAISEELEVPIAGGYTVTCQNWQAFATSVPLTWIYEVVGKYKEDTFSANVRGYLGSRKSKHNINAKIKHTAQNEAENFWAFNNGITALVYSFEEVKNGNDPQREEDLLSSIHDCANGSRIDETQKILKIRGLSIINGAQTAGSIGNLESRPNEWGRVPIRFVQSKNSDIIKKIISYNNSQNVVEASDFRSNDRVQRRLREEFDKVYPEWFYPGGRRGGSEDKIKRRGDKFLASDTVAQALAAFHGDPVTAYNKKSEIWINDSLYSQYFPDILSAEHIVFCYSLLKATESKKKDLLQKKKSGQIRDSESKQLQFLQERGSIPLFVASIGNSLETILGQRIIDTFRVSFHGKIFPDYAQAVWMPIIESAIPFSSKLKPAVEKSLSNNQDVKRVISEFGEALESVRELQEPKYAAFSEVVLIRTSAENR